MRTWAGNQSPVAQQCDPVQIKTFNEACLMVRKPALELIGYLKKANPAHPSVRYVLCIPDGNE
ncbi:UNVERIFIED_CONTAM: hypothetical protein FKN15_054744 [Acipenser sinensis]